MSRTPRAEGGVGSAAPISATRPIPSPRLSDKGKAYFAELERRLDESGGASDTYADVMNMAARVMCEIEDLEDHIDEEGMTVTKTTRYGDDEQLSPQAKRLDTLRPQLKALLETLGLSVAARRNVKPKAPKAGQNAGGDFGSF